MKARKRLKSWKAGKGGCVPAWTGPWLLAAALGLCSAAAGGGRTDAEAAMPGPDAALRVEGEWHAAYRHYRPDEAFDEDTFETRLGLTAAGGAEGYRFTASGRLETGAPSDRWEGGFDWPRDTERQRRAAELNEWYLRVYGLKYDLVLGKRVFRHGLSPLYSPADRYSRRDYTDPLDIRHLGRWQARLDAYAAEGVDLSATVFPLYEPAKVPAADSRWAAAVLPEELLEDGAAAEALLESSESVPAATMENVGYLLCAKKSCVALDLFASVYNGLTYRSVLRGGAGGDAGAASLPAGMTGLGAASFAPGEETVRATEVAAGAVLAPGAAWGLHAEGVYSAARSGRDDDFVSYVLGGSYRLDPAPGFLMPEQVVLVLEYAGESVSRRRSDGDAAPGSQEYRFGRNDVLGRAEVRVDSRVRLRLTGAVELDEGSGYAQLRGRYRVRDGLAVALTADLLGGDADGYYGRAGGNDRMVLSCEHRF